MKEGWTYKKLGEVCDYSIGLTYKPTDVCDNGTIVLRSSNIQNGQIDLNDIVRVSCPIKDSLFVNKGDILMCSRNGSARLVGKVAIIPDIKERMTYGTFMMIIRSDYNPFLFYYFNSDIFRKQIKHGEANMINQITRYMLDDVVVSLPPLSDQQRIVSRLDAAFSHIDELKANAEKQLTEARALFQKSLDKAMEPKEGWKVKTLKEIGITQTGTTPSKSEVSNYGDFIPFIRPSEIDCDGCGSIDYNSEIKLSEKGLKNGRLFKKQSILMVCIGATIGKVGYCTQDVSCNQQINVLTPIKDSYKFIYYAMRNKDFNDKVIKGGTSAQATLPIINKGKWEAMTISLPPLSEQQRIVERLDALSAHVRELEEIQKKIISECDALKQALLRKVFE